MSQEFVRFEDLLRAYRQSYVLFSAFKLGILENLAQKSQTTTQLHQKINSDLRGLEMILAALLSMKIVQKINNKFTLNPNLASYLNPASPKYSGNQIDHENFLMKRWEHLTESIRTGQPVKKTTDPGTPETIHRFISAMSDLGQRSASIVLKKISFSEDKKILDLGGGPGRYMEAFVNAYPKVTVTLFDQPESIAAAREFLQKHSCYNRMVFIPGDFFKNSFGNHYDTIFLSNIVHIYGPEENRILFKKCWHHLNIGGRILIKDMFLKTDRSSPLNTTLFSLHMLLSTDSGKCYTIEEMKNILKDTGFQYKRAYSLTQYSKIVEATRGAN